MADPLLIPHLLSLTALQCPGMFWVGSYPVEELRMTRRQNGSTAPAEGHSRSARDRNRDRQHDPLRLLCDDPGAIQAARRLAQSVRHDPDHVAALFLIMSARQDEESQ